jgi:hypothetical protein
MNILEILKDDYQQFPLNQTYSIYADNVYFKDPLNEFRGLDRYKQMIRFIRTWFRDIKMDLHDIRRVEDTIYTEWTLNWTTPVPWQPRIAIPGRSELKLNEKNLIVSHIDYWHCSRLDVIKQHLFPK